MKQLHPIALLLVVGCGTPAERVAERALREGEDPYRKGNFNEAAKVYATASFDPRVAYNQGNALFRSGLLDTAITSFTSAIEVAHDPAGKALAHHNLGNSWSALAMRSDSTVRHIDGILSSIRIEGDDIGRKVRQVVMRDSLRTAQQGLAHLVDSAWTQGADAYKNALRIDPLDEDARHNLALAQRHIALRRKAEADRKEKEEKEKSGKGLSERAELLMQKADELVEQYRFGEALDLLKEGLKADPTLQQEQEYMGKLDVVTEAAKAK